MKTSFDSTHADLSPGYVLRAELMQYMFDLGIREYDFLGANERYKLEWSQLTRKEFNLSLYNSGNWLQATLRAFRRCVKNAD